MGRAIQAARSIAGSLGLAADDVRVLHDSNKLTLRLLPCDLVARVALAPDLTDRFELELAQLLADTGAPVGVVEPRVAPLAYEHDGFVATLWVYYASGPSEEIPPAGYAAALSALHDGMRTIDHPAPDFSDRVASALQVVTNPELSPDLAPEDRELLTGTLQELGRSIADRAGVGQLLHGEPHPGNVLNTTGGLRFVDLETVCRGPVEFDLAHAPEEVAEFYPGLDDQLLRDCRLLMLAMIISWRWDRADRLPDGRRLGVEWLTELRARLLRRTCRGSSVSVRRPSWSATTGPWSR
jgi:hypothetical protein